jgi:hypothetical protein
MSRYEFSFVVTEVELSEEQRRRVGRAVALAGAAAVGDKLPAAAVTAPVETEDARYLRYWCGIPPVIEFSGDIDSVLED